MAKPYNKTSLRWFENEVTEPHASTKKHLRWRIWSTHVWTWVCQRRVVVPLCVRLCALVHAREPVVGVKARSWQVDNCSTKWRCAQRAKSSVNAWLQEFARDTVPHVLIIDWRLHLRFLIVCLYSRNDSSMAFDSIAIWRGQLLLEVRPSLITPASHTFQHWCAMLLAWWMTPW